MRPRSVATSCPSCATPCFLIIHRSSVVWAFSPLLGACPRPSGIAAAFLISLLAEFALAESFFGFHWGFRVVVTVRVLRPRCPFRAPAPVSRARHNPLTGRAVMAGAEPPLRGYKPPALAALAPAIHFFSASALSCAQVAMAFPLGAVARGLPLLRPARMPANCRPFLSAGAMNSPSESRCLCVVGLCPPMR